MILRALLDFNEKKNYRNKHLIVRYCQIYNNVCRKPSSTNVQMGFSIIFCSFFLKVNQI